VNVWNYLPSDVINFSNLNVSKRIAQCKFYSVSEVFLWLLSGAYNFGLKSGGTNSEGERGALGYQRRKERRMGRKYPPPHPTLGSERAAWALPARSGRSPGRKWFYCTLFSADRFCWQQVTANSSPFCPEKWGVLYPSVQKVGIPVPLVNYADRYYFVFWILGKQLSVI